jgi:hypothetical protein
MVQEHGHGQAAKSTVRVYHVGDWGTEHLPWRGHEKGTQGNEHREQGVRCHMVEPAEIAEGPQRASEHDRLSQGNLLLSERRHYRKERLMIS